MGITVSENRRPVPRGRATLWLVALGLLGFFALAGALQAADYLLGPDDILTVTVLRHPELSVEAMPVRADGTISLPVAGEVQVAGQTVQQVTDAITKRLSRRLVNPEVTVAVQQARSLWVFVLGAVGKPGVYDMKPGWRVTEALAAAGGLVAKPEMTSGSLLRPDGTTLPLDLPNLLAGQGPALNLPLAPGDVLNLVERTITVSVAGQVLKPGTHEVRAGGGVLEALSLAGGVTPQADLTKVTVRRADGSETLLNLVPVMVEGDLAGNVTLAPGDLLLVPEATAKVAVLGAVVSPGHFDLEPGVPRRVTDVLALASGLTVPPERAQGFVFRADGSSVPLDLAAILTAGNAAANLTLLPDDVISLAVRTVHVSVAGQVMRPGEYDLPAGGGVVEAVALAGGLAPRAALQSVLVQRPGGATQTVDMFRIMVRGDLEGNVSLGAGDLVMVPESKARIAVLGAVGKPGYFDIDEAAPPTVAQAVALAGGAQKRARVGETAVVRLENGQPTRTVVDLNRILRDGDVKADLPVHDGDLIFVPDAKVDWDMVLRALSAFSWLGWVFD